MTFNSDIKAIDSCRVCHSGPEYHVEIDIVLDGEMPLWRAHDIAQDLQDQLEDLPNINRCFVHVDHESEHKPVRAIYTAAIGVSASSNGRELTRAIFSVVGAP
jgi:divalent metal cation (Fe/Co/Zn/Cd) transporter